MDVINSSDDGSCLACLEQYSTHQLISASSKSATIEGSEQTIAEIYYQCTQLVCEENDSYCKWICQNCTEKLVEFFNFRKMCIASYNRLKVVLRNESVKEEMIDEWDSSMDYVNLNDAHVESDETRFECVDMEDAISNECKKENTKSNEKNHEDCEQHSTTANDTEQEQNLMDKEGDDTEANDSVSDFMVSFSQHVFNK